MALRILDETNFDEVIANSKIPVLVDFFADWCQPCHRMTPILEGIAQENEGKFLICKVDVDGNKALAEKYQVKNIPSLISFKGGATHKKRIGVISKEQILEMFE